MPSGAAVYCLRCPGKKPARAYRARLPFADDFPPSLKFVDAVYIMCDGCAKDGERWFEERKASDA